MALTIIAYNIYTGGGKVLLDQLIHSLQDEPDVEMWIDGRNLIKFDDKFKVHWVKPTLWSRIKAEWEIKARSNDARTFLFFGNLPPLFSLNASSRVFVFLQNKYIVISDTTNYASFSSTVRSVMERIWFRSRFKPHYQYLVQTEHMREAFKTTFPHAHCLVQPFFDFPPLQKKSVSSSFIYVSSTDTHKNHRVLVEAMGILARDGIKPVLKLVFNQHESPWLVDVVYRMNSETGSRIEMVGPIERAELISHYQNSSCLIFPSKLESFGLPLLEAEALGLDIIASELDYVRELVDPVQSFDPSSAQSIARAIQRYLNLPTAKTKVISSQDFLKSIC